MVTSPAGVAGAVDVTVVTVGGTSVTSVVDEFTYIGGPAVTGMIPAVGPVSGGTTVTISGTGLANATAVKFGTVAATIVSNSDTQLVVTSPAGIVGTVDVTVVTAGGTSGVTGADQFTYAAAPTVTGLSPASGPATGGSTVTIAGTGLANATAVMFGGKLATIVSSSATQLVVTAPAGVAGKVDVTVMTAGGTSAITVADQFTYLPAVTGVSPVAGPLSGGTAVTITGVGFTGATAVYFGGVVGTSLVVKSDTQITVTSPAGTGAVDVRVVTGVGTSAITAVDQFSYVGVPVVGGISPSAGPITGGTTVTITGTALANALQVKFGGVLATIVSDSGSQLVVIAPAGIAGTVDVTVVTAGGTSATLAADQFTYVAAPTLTTIGPATGPATGGSVVTITGTNLANATAVYFGTTLATILSNSGTQIVVTSPANVVTTNNNGTVTTQYLGGTVDITVLTVGGTSPITAADQFTYVASPTVTGISPAAGPVGGGTTVTISGTNLANASYVFFGTQRATIVSDSGTQLVVTAPAGIVGTVDVTVVTAVGTSAPSAADQFTYAAVPAVTGVSPASGPATGGSTVTIAGTGLANATAVMFGSNMATIVSNSATQLVVIAPAGAAGTVDVTVVTAGGTSLVSGTDRFTYMPAVTGVSPVTGPQSGGTTVTITGVGFTGATAVYFGGVLGTSLVVKSDTQITVTSPAGTGAVDVRVVTGVGTSAITSADQFSYVAVPAVTGISPSAGPAVGGTRVTITGTGLANALQVKFGGVLATIVSDSGSQLVVTAPAGVAGTVDVTVVTAGGTSAITAADQFTYVAAPAVATIGPAAGPITGGTTVTITGTNLANATAVYFGTNLATIVSNSGTQIVVTTPANIVTTTNNGTVTTQYVAGTVDITVQTIGGTSAVLPADQFTYVAVPTVANVSPAAGPVGGGTTVTITGTGLANASAVMFGDALATILSDSDTVLVVASPANPAGNAANAVDITVVTTGGTSATSAADQFTFTPRRRSRRSVRPRAPLRALPR